MPPNRTVAVELKMLVADYIANAKRSGQATKENAQQVLALSRAELDFRSAIDQASAAVKANGATLDKSTAQGRANQASLDQIATSSRQYRATLIAQGATQEEINAATLAGRTAWLSTASAMGMGEQQAKRLSGTLFAATRTLETHRAELSAVATTLGLVGAGMLVIAGKGVKSFADFDKQMSAVAATGDDARASLDGLRQTAIQAGAATQFSATEAAEGVTNLLKAGVKAEDVIGGGLTGALNLAAAGNMSVADAAEVAANTLNQFGLKGQDVAHVADLLVAGANSASGEVSDMAAALNNVGSVAHASGLSLEETVGFLTEMAYAGHTGAEAGTQFKSMLMQLQAPSEKQKAALNDLNLSLYDSEGRTKSLTQFVDEYRASLDGKTQAEKDSYNATIFGSYGIQAANVAYSQAGGTLKEWIATVEQQGIAQRQAAELTNNLSGDVERLGGSLDTVFIQSGSGANNVLRQMAQGAEELVNGIGQLPGPLLSIATMLTGSGGIAVLGVAGIAKLGSTVLDARNNFKLLGFSANTAKLAVVGVGAAVAIGTIALMAWAQEAADARQRTDNLSSTLVVLDGKATTTAATLKEINDQFNDTRTADWGPSVLQMMNAVGVSAADAQQYVLGNADAIKKVQDQVDSYVLHNGLMSTGSGLLVQLDKIRSSTQGAIKDTEDKAKADREAGVATTSYADAVSKTTTVTQDNTDATQDNTDTLEKWIKAQWAAADAALALSGSYTGFERMLDTTAESTDKLVKSTKHKTDLTNLDTKAGQDAKDILDKIASSTLTHVKAMEKAQEPQKKITSEIERGREALVKQARQMGFSETAIADLVAKYDLLPENVTTTIDENGASTAQTRIDNLLTSVKKLPKKQQAEILSTFNTKGLEAAEAALNKIDKKTVHPKIDPQLTKSTVVVKVVRGSGGSGGGRADLDNADGGILASSLAGIIREFASGGFGQPQIRPFQGAAGVLWGEQGSGPWEAFISGAPQKKIRSRAIASDVVGRLGGVAQFADGGIAEPTWNGMPLSYWKDELKTNLELTRLQISIRDLKKSLVETETYNPPGKKKKATRLKLRGLDAVEARQQLAEDENELKLSLLAQQLNASKSGTIDAQIAAWQTADQNSRDAWQQAQQDATDAQQAADQLASQSASNAQKWMDQYMTGSSYADLLANMNAGANSLVDFQNGLARLQNQGLNKTVLDYIAGTGSADLLNDVIAQGKAGIDALNGVTTNLATATDSLGKAQASSDYTTAPVLNNVTLPSYMTSGSAGASGSLVDSRQVVFQITQSDPYAVAVAVDQKLRYLT